MKRPPVSPRLCCWVVLDCAWALVVLTRCLTAKEARVTVVEFATLEKHPKNSTSVTRAYLIDSSSGLY